MMRGMQIDNVLSFTPLSTPQQRYLTQVYALLAAGCVATWGGYSLANLVPLGGVLPGVLSIGLLLYVHGSQPSAKGRLDATRDKPRCGAFLGFSAVTGMTLAPLLDYAYFVSPSAVNNALLATTVVFVCWSLSAMFTKDRRYLMMGGGLASAASYMMLVQMAHMFFRTQITHTVLLWGGLALSSFYVLYQTQAAIYEFDQGCPDVVRRAMMFYGECVQIFSRILIILVEMQEKRRGDDRRRRRD